MKWPVHLLEEGQNYQITFPNGDKSKVELKRIQAIGCDNHYVFSPLTENDRVFTEHENWQMLGWEEPWWFPLPEGILLSTDIRPIEENFEPLTNEEIHYTLLIIKIQKLNQVTVDDILKNLNSTGSLVNDILNFAKETDINKDMKEMIFEAMDCYTEKLELAITKSK